MYNLEVNFHLVCLDSPNVEYFQTEYKDMSYGNFQSFRLWPDTHSLTII